MTEQNSSPAPHTPAINFYHLTATPLEHALPKLLEKALSGGYRVLVVAENEARVEQLNSFLWTYDPNGFLPHGSVAEARAEAQPILIASDFVPLNSANLLIVTDGRLLPDSLQNYERVLDIFDGNDESKISSARTRWTAYKNAKFDISYFQQTENGGWQKKA